MNDELDCISNTTCACTCVENINLSLHVLYTCTYMWNTLTRHVEQSVHMYMWKTESVCIVHVEHAEHADTYHVHVLYM